MTNMQQIEQLTAVYAAARETLSGIVGDLQAEIDRLSRQRLPEIRHAVQAVADAHAPLYEALEAAPDLFKKPRTKTFSGVRVGYMLGKPSVEIPDEAETIRRIRNLLPTNQADLLIAVTERVDKSTVADLTDADLHRLRIHIAEAKDSVVIKPTDSAVDKAVKALLKDAERIDRKLLSGSSPASQ